MSNPYRYPKGSKKGGQFAPKYKEEVLTLYEGAVHMLSETGKNCFINKEQ